MRPPRAGEVQDGLVRWGCSVTYGVGEWHVVSDESPRSRVCGCGLRKWDGGKWVRKGE